MKSYVTAIIGLVSMLLSSCIQNQSHKFKSWIGVGNCSPSLLQREFRVIDNNGKSLDNFSITVLMDAPAGLIPSPFYGDFIDMERTLHGGNLCPGFRVQIINGKVSNSRNFSKEYSLNPIQVISNMNNDRIIRITYPTYFPKSMCMYISKDGGFAFFSTMIIDMPVGEVSSLTINKLR